MGHKKVQRIDPCTQALGAGGVDSHAHLDDEAFDADRDAVLQRAQTVGIRHIMNIFLDPTAFATKKALFAAYPWVYFVLGIHPCDGLRFGEEAFMALERAFSGEERLRAVGEIGLDYHWPDCPKEIQWEILDRQLDIARKLQKPVVIHCREAEDDCLAILEGHGFSGYPLLWHCFGGSRTLAARLVRNGWYVSVPGPVTYPANHDLHDAVTCIPDDRLLCETDCPYLSPNPWRGTRNEPAYTVFTIRALASARGEDAEELWQICGANARRFFGLPES